MSVSVVVCVDVSGRGVGVSVVVCVDVSGRGVSVFGGDVTVEM